MDLSFKFLRLIHFGVNDSLEVVGTFDSLGQPHHSSRAWFIQIYCYWARLGRGRESKLELCWPCLVLVLLLFSLIFGSIAWFIPVLLLLILTFIGVGVVTRPEVEITMFAV